MLEKAMRLFAVVSEQDQSSRSPAAMFVRATSTRNDRKRSLFLPLAMLASLNNAANG